MTPEYLPQLFARGLWEGLIYGTIDRMPDFTRFNLELESSEGQVLGITVFESNTDLAQHPDLYGQILDRMTYEVEKAWKEHTAPFN